MQSHVMLNSMEGGASGIRLLKFIWTSYRKPVVSKVLGTPPKIIQGRKCRKDTHAESFGIYSTQYTHIYIGERDW